jgi:hypothetical protein
MLEEVIKSYKTVIEDITDDDTWLEDAKEQVLSLLRTRLMELTTIWSIPDELWHAEFDEVELPAPDQPDGNEDPDHCSSCNGIGEDRYEQRCVSCGGSGRES